MNRSPNFLFFVMIMIFSLSLLAWGFCPPRREVVSLPLFPADGMPSLSEKRMTHLTYSPKMRAGETQIIELNLVTVGEDTDYSPIQEYGVIAEARLDFPFVDVRPVDVVSTALVGGGDATFYWEVSPLGEGDLQGTVWLYLRFIPNTGGQEIRQPVSAQVIKIRSMSLLGWTGSEVRAAGVIGLLLGLVLGIPVLRSRRVNS